MLLAPLLKAGDCIHVGACWLMQLFFFDELHVLVHLGDAVLRGEEEWSAEKHGLSVQQASG